MRNLQDEKNVNNYCVKYYLSILDIKLENEKF